ncbi:ABC transporter permease [Bdellovibrionota bacterium FG-1]
MLIYAARRILGAIPTLFLLCTLTFFLLRLAPGGPFDSERVWPPEIQANIQHKYELDQPLAVQYGHWLKDVLRGDLRESFQYVGRPVADIISEALPTSVFLGIISLVFAAVLGIPLGAIAAAKRGSWIDASAVFVAVAGVSLPSYLVASLLILVFSLWLHWLPPALWEGPSSWVLPTIALGCRPLSMIARLTRASMLEALQADYIRTAYSKGLSQTQVIFKHALKNSLIPVITVLGPVAANLVTGSFLVEIVFQIPGLGKHFVQAVVNRDYPLVMGVTLVYGIVLLSSNLLVDLAYGWIDPRMRANE